jgi:type 1 glutamine amidotransferase
LEEWWKKPIRAVTLELPAADIKSIDIRDIVRRFARDGVNTLNVFAISYWPGGAAFYQSSIAPRHPDLGDRDLLATAIDEAHKHNMKVVAYVNVLWGDRNMFEKHPEWAQRRANGKITTWEPSLTTVAMCPNTPYLDYILKVVKEISNNYEVDGFYFDEPCFQSWCNCEGCRQAFKKQFDEELPTQAKWGDPLWQKFVKWRYDKITEYKKALYEASKKENRAIFFQHPFPLAFWSRRRIMAVLSISEDVVTRFVKDCANWYVPLFYGADLEATAALEDILHFELYRKGVDQPLWWYGICIRLGRSVGKGKPVLVLNMQGYSPFDLYSLPEAELRLAVGEIVANDGNALFAFYYPDVADKRGWKILSNIFHELESCEEYLINRASVKFAAVLHSQRTIDFFDSDAESVKHVDCIMGFCKALLQDHILFDVITEKQLKENLKNYKVIVLPNVASLSDDECKLIEKFVKEGGGVVASYRTSLFAEDGSKLGKLGLEDVLGATYSGKEKIVMGYDTYMSIKAVHPVTEHLEESMYIPSTGTQLEIRGKEKATALATLIDEPEAHYAPLKKDTRIPTILVNEYGKGKSVYFPGPIGDIYLKFGVMDHQKLIANAVRWVAKERQSVWVENCPNTVELTAYKQSQKDRTIIHLVNCIRNEIDEPITYASSESNVKIFVGLTEPQHSYKVFTIPEKKILSQKKEKNMISFNVPEFRYHQMIVVEKV